MSLCRLDCSLTASMWSKLIALALWSVYSRKDAGTSWSEAILDDLGVEVWS